jgi:phenylpyruvate tautomerase PptA (4-oxalocrotonate tautomerase family)
MPMIDVTAVAGTFADKRSLTKNLTAAMMRWEKVPPIALFRENTAAFVHELSADAMSNAAGDSNYVRVNVLTPTGVLDRDKKLGVVKEMTEIVALAAGDPTLAQRTWVLISESPDGGWGIDGHAYTNAEIADAARRELSAK